MTIPPEMIEACAKALCCPGTACMMCAEGECAAPAFEPEARAAIRTLAPMMAEMFAVIAAESHWVDVDAEDAIRAKGKEMADAQLPE